jgi:hypothetical protein
MDKVGLGRTKTSVAFYSDFIVVQASLYPLVLAVVASPDANVGLISAAAVPHLQRVLDPVRRKADVPA